jgi:glutamate N-acetyltransferase/amino-acid N-acetyltransferase
MWLKRNEAEKQERKGGVKIYKKAILPIGFKASGISCGIKKSGKLDLALFYADIPAEGACLFTTNGIQAAPIKVCKKYLKQNKKFQAIIVNSGNANCFTGQRGLRNAYQTTQYLAKTLSIKKENVLVASTGIIGRDLPVDKIKKAIPKLVANLSRHDIDKAKKAILTTDLFTKEITLKANIGGRTITICGVAKGAGMIAPHLATMLAFIFTDADITKGALKRALKVAVESSFNCITVDGCMSTNDTIMILANGAARNNIIDLNKNFKLFTKALGIICLELARLIIRDAEGATKFIQIKVSGAKNYAEARKAALSIANSNLFKTAIYGKNPNFGRIIAAVGASGITIREDKLRVKASSLGGKDIFIGVYLNIGKASACVYTSDLTPEYIKINAEYN